MCRSRVPGRRWERDFDERDRSDGVGCWGEWERRCECDGWGGQGARSDEWSDGLPGGGDLGERGDEVGVGVR